MQEITLGTMLAVFEEIFGTGIFWGMVIVAALVTIGFLYVLVRDRSVSWKKFLLAQIAMPFGAIGAVLFVQAMTDSDFSDIGGPIDVIVLLGIAGLGACGIAILVYTVEALIGSRRTTGGRA